MKVKVTKKEIQENYRNIIAIGYCDAQYLLKYKNPDYYSAGVYGWSCDYYNVGYSTIISTGYAPIGIYYVEIIEKYEKIAKDNTFNHYEEEKKFLDNLLNECIEEIMKKIDGGK